MKWLVLSTAMLLSACSFATYSYTVETAEAHSPVRSASVDVCSQREWPLERSGTVFSGSSTDSCEGSGVIRLVHADGTITECRVGYVTTTNQSLAFAVRGRSCELLEAQFGSE